jgi:hypothetical protein
MANNNMQQKNGSLADLSACMHGSWVLLLTPSTYIYDCAQAQGLQVIRVYEL